MAMDLSSTSMPTTRFAKFPYPKHRVSKTRYVSSTCTNTFRNYSQISTNSKNPNSQIHEIERLCAQSKTKSAIQFAEQLLKEGSAIQSQTLILLLQSSAESRSLASVRKTHQIILRSQHKISPIVCKYIASVYYKLGGKANAQQVLDEMFRRPKTPKKENYNQRREAYDKVRQLHDEIRAIGYVPNTKCVLQDIDEEAKKEALMYHSERLAIAFGLISTPHGTTLRIMKNIRICGDCHNAVKFISKVVEREIIMRDNKRFHHFKDGACSCGDYW